MTNTTEDPNVVAVRVMAELEDLIIQIGPGFNPDNLGADYTSLPEGVTAQDIDRAVDAVVALGIDIEEFALDIIEDNFGDLWAQDGDNDDLSFVPETGK